MKLKKLLAGVTAAALAVGLVAVTPLVSSADTTSAEADTLPLKTWTLEEGGKDEDAYVVEIPNDVAPTVAKLDIMFTDVSTDYLQLYVVQDGGYMNGEDWVSDFKQDLFVATISGSTAVQSVEFGSTPNMDGNTNALTGFLAADTKTNINIFPNWMNAGSASLHKVICYDSTGAEVYTEVGELDEPKTTITLWEGSETFGNWAKSVIIPAETFNQFTAGGKVTVTLTSSDAEAQYGTRYIVPGGSEDGTDLWAEILSYSAYLGTDVTSVTSTITDEQLELLQQYDFVVAGHDITVTKVEYTCYTKDVIANVPVTAITVTGAPTEAMEIGDTAELKAEVEPETATDSSVAWSSSDTKVATVDEDGVVTAVSAGTATITAASVSDPTVKGTAKITVAAAIVEVEPSINVTEVTVNKENVSDQKNEVEGKVEVTIEGLTEGKDFTTAIAMTEAAGEADSKATVTVTLTTAGAAKYKIAEGKETFEVNVKFVNLDDSEYQGYTAETTVDIDAAEGDADDDVKAAVQAAIEAKTITLKGVETDDQTGKIGTVKSDMDLSGIKAETGKYTVSVDVDVYKIIRQGKDLYYPEGATLGDSTNASSKITLTFTVNVTAPEKPDEPTPEEPKPEEPKPEDPTPVDPKPEDPTPVDPKPEDPTPVDPTPVDPTPDTPSTPETPAVVPTTTNNRVGDGGTVPTDINTGAAFTGTRAMEEVSRAKSGDSINIVMTGGMNEGEIIAKIAYKKDVTVNLKYSAYTISINSDDVSEDFEAKGFYSTARFLSAKEKAAFAGAKELRQISVKNLDGIEKATITVTMRGGSKGMDATALNRISAGKYKTVETGKVAEDRTFSFEITKAGNYVVYTGKIDMGE